MNFKPNKIKLSPRLNMGIGRSGSKYNFYNVGGSVLVVLSIVLAIRAGYLLITSDQTNSQNPQVLGAVDNQQQPNSEQKQAYKTHVVKSGDTLFNISQTYGIDWTVVATLNNLEPPFSLKIGQELKIPQK